MTALPQPLYAEVTAALREAGRDDLAEKLLAFRPRRSMTSGEAAALLGVSSRNTVKNWLEGGFFPGAYKTPGGHWRFLRDEVESVKARMDELREKNRRGEVAPPEEDDEAAPPVV